MNLRVLGCLLAILCVSLPARAWDAFGHMATAVIAYERLTPPVRARVDKILSGHPDYGVWMAALPANADRGLEAFIAASLWPDLIRGDSRFYDETARMAEPTPQLPGFPDMQIHSRWHFINLPYAPGGEPAPAAGEPNIVTQIRSLSGSVTLPYSLPWLIHLVGDIHQPLHSVARFTGKYIDPVTNRDRGDRGGNSFLIDHPARNLHSFWDRAMGRPENRKQLLQLAAAAAATVRAGDAGDLDVQRWVDESFQLATKDVYRAGADAPGSLPPSIPAAYRTRAEQIARERIGLAGHRLAGLLNRLLP